MLKFLQFLYESLAATQSPLQTEAGSYWYNSKTNEFRNIDHTDARYDDAGNIQTSIDSATYHAGYVAKNPHLFDLTEEDLVKGLDQYETRFPGSSGKGMLKQLKNGFTDTHPVLDNMVMKKGWVRIVRSGSSSPRIYAQGTTRGLHALARHVQKSVPAVRALSLDVHGANQEYGHIDSSIMGISHVLEGQDDIDQFVESGGKPNRRYSRIIRVQSK